MLNSCVQDSLSWFYRYTLLKTRFLASSFVVLFDLSGNAFTFIIHRIVKTQPELYHRERVDVESEKAGYHKSHNLQSYWLDFTFVFICQLSLISQLWRDGWLSRLFTNQAALRQHTLLRWIVEWSQRITASWDRRESSLQRVYKYLWDSVVAVTMLSAYHLHKYPHWVVSVDQIDKERWTHVFLWEIYIYVTTCKCMYDWASK